MKKTIRNSLAARIFLLTVVLLAAIGAVTYICIARMLPAVYTNELESGLENAADWLLKELADYDSIEDAWQRLAYFEGDNQAFVKIIDEDGAIVYPDVERVQEIAADFSESAVTFGIQEDVQGEAAQRTDVQGEAAQQKDVQEEAAKQTDGQAGTAGQSRGRAEEAVQEDDQAGTAEQRAGQAEEAEQADGQAGTAEQAAGQADTAVSADVQITAKEDGTVIEGEPASATRHYDLTIGKEKYTMEIRGTMQAVNQAEKVLKNILPYLIPIIALTALACALLASYYLAAPIRRLSTVSQNMAKLDFRKKCREGRGDEIGILAANLNQMSEKLDITLKNLQEANRQLKSDVEKEREQEKKRTAFFAAVSHELKTPVTILKGHLDGMQKRVGGYQDRDYYLKRSYEAACTMEGMVQEILTVARMDAGGEKRRMEKLDLAELFRLQMASMVEWMEQRKITWDLNMPGHVYCTADRLLIEKTAGNLCTNAVRYSPEGAHITVTLKEEQGNILGSVENTGVHIPGEALPHLFEAFYRVDASRNRETGGTGLGLYIVRTALQQHNGICSAENTKDGVRVWFQLPNSTKNT